MANPATYAAVRLKQIKANPAPWADVWTWRQEFAAADTPALRREVVGLARQVGSDSLLAVLVPALASDDSLVRLDAARSIALLSEERLRDGFAIGVDAADPEIRAEVMDLILQLQPHLRAELLRVALAAAATDVQARAVDTITDFPNPAFFGVLIEGLRTATPEARPLVEQAIADLVQQRFESYNQALAWWTQNKENFDDLMTRIQ
jgi:HEAT repeat protein